MGKSTVTGEPVHKHYTVIVARPSINTWRQPLPWTATLPSECPVRTCGASGLNVHSRLPKARGRLHRGSGSLTAQDKGLSKLREEYSRVQRLCWCTPKPISEFLTLQ